MVTCFCFCRLYSVTWDYGHELNSLKGLQIRALISNGEKIKPAFAEWDKKQFSDESRQTDLKTSYEAF
jgi:hypothetical protein